MSSPAEAIERRFESALIEASQKLESLAIIRGRPVSLKGLRGWIFEQTVRTCLEEELEKRGIAAAITEQASIGGRATVDLLIGSIAIEIKVAGFFNDVGERYLSYRKTIEAKGWEYFYLTLSETYMPYREVARRAFGKERAFFLSEKGEWSRFIVKVVRILREKKCS